MSATEKETTPDPAALFEDVSREPYYIITESARRVLAIHGGWELYVNLVGLVTAEVPDPEYDGKKIGIVLGGHAMTNPELAIRIGYEEWKLRREKGSLVRAGLLIQRRHQYGFRLAIRFSNKRVRRQRSLDKVPWLQQALSEPHIESSDCAESVQSEVDSRLSGNCAIQCTNPLSLATESAQSETGSDLRSQQDTDQEKKLKRKMKRESSKTPKTHTPITTLQTAKEQQRDQNQGQDTATFTGRPDVKAELSATPVSSSPGGSIPQADDMVESLCSRLYSIGREVGIGAFYGRNREILRRLLESYSDGEIVNAWDEHVNACTDKFERSQATFAFCNGAGVAILRARREQAEVERAEEAERQKQAAEKAREQRLAQVASTRLNEREAGAVKEAETWKRDHGDMTGFVPSDQEAFRVSELRRRVKENQDDFWAKMDAERQLCRLRDSILVDLRLDPKIIAAAALTLVAA